MCKGRYMPMHKGKKQSIRSFAWRSPDITCKKKTIQFISVQSLSCVRLFAIPWTAARQASLSSSIYRNLLRFVSSESVMLCNHLILCCPLLLPSVLPSIRVFSSESTLCIRWPKYWSFSFSISPSSEYSGLNLVQGSQSLCCQEERGFQSWAEVQPPGICIYPEKV